MAEDSRRAIRGQSHVGAKSLAEAPILGPYIFYYNMYLFIDYVPKPC